MRLADNKYIFIIIDKNIMRETLCSLQNREGSRGWAVLK